MGESMSEEAIPYKTIEEFYEAIRKDVPEIMEAYSKEEKVKRTITVPRTFDTVLHRVMRADLLRLHDMEMNYNDLLVAFAMIGLAAWSSKEVITKLSDEANFLDAYEEIKKIEET